MSRTTTTRLRNGVREALFGGYVGWDLRVKDPRNGMPKRVRKEVRVWLRADLTEDDCGAGTNELVAALKAKVGDKPYLEVYECWRY